MDFSKEDFSKEHQTTSAYLPTGLNLVNGTTIVADLVADLQRELILFVVGPYDGVSLSFYREGQTIFSWRTTERLSSQQLSATAPLHQTLTYPLDHQEQCEVIRTLLLETFFALPVAEEGERYQTAPPETVFL